MNLEELMQQAKDGDMVAQYDLAEQYGKRLKVAERDDEIREYSRQAVYWLKQSAKQGYGPAVEAVRELNIQMGEPEQLINEAAEPPRTAAAEPQKPAKKLSGDTRVMHPIGSEDEIPDDHRALQEARQKSESLSRTNLLLVILLGVSLLLNIFLVVFLFRTLRDDGGKPAPKSTEVPAATVEPTKEPTAPSASPSALPSATPAATNTPALTPEPTVEPTPEPGRKGWLDLSQYPDLEVVPGEDSIYDDYVYYAVTVSTQLNMRSGPGTSYNLIGAIPDATKIGAVAKSEGGKWYLVYYDGKFGWVSSGYLTTNLNYATASPAQ